MPIMSNVNSVFCLSRKKKWCKPFTLQTLRSRWEGRSGGTRPGQVFFREELCSPSSAITMWSHPCSPSSVIPLCHASRKTFSKVKVNISKQWTPGAFIFYFFKFFYFLNFKIFNSYMRSPGAFNKSVELPVEIWSSNRVFPVQRKYSEHWTPFSSSPVP